jgi:hypothetical protein
MNRPPSDHFTAACDDGLNFCLFGQPSETITQSPRQNTGGIGVVTLDKHGTFVSRRLLNEAELAQAWDEHFARHGLTA